MIPTRHCKKHEHHEGHEWGEGPDLAWCDGLRQARDETNRRGRGTVAERRDF